MNSTLKRLNSIVFAASAVALAVGSPAHARRSKPEQPSVVNSANLMTGSAAAIDSQQPGETVRDRAGRRKVSRRPIHEPRGRAIRNGGTPYGRARNAVPTNRQDLSSHERSANLDRSAPALGLSGRAGSDVIGEARRWIGTNPTDRSSLWCAAFMNFVLERTGHRGTGSNLARSFASYGYRVSGPQVGAIAVMARRGRAAGGGQGGHVGVVSGVDSNGNPVIISGNHGRRVAEAVYPHNRVYAYVMPN